MDRSRTLSAALFLSLAVAGCSASHSVGDDAAVRTDAASGDDGGVPCGTALCTGGETCCGGCPGDPPLGCFAGGCPPVACPFEWTVCEDALRDGRAGEPCDFEGECGEGASCCSATARCEAGALVRERDCAPGCFACASNADCEGTEFCDFSVHGCDGPGACTPRPTGCPEDCPGVCACDGTTHCNACSANAAGASVARPGACEAIECTPQDAHGQGECALFLGYRWNGTTCEGIGGCSCVGADCAELYGSPDECAADHAACAVDL